METRPRQAAEAAPSNAALLRGRKEHHAPEAQTVAAPTPARVGYGLPCLQCGTYYTADLTACPRCKTTERVSPRAGAVAVSTAAQEAPASDIVEQEREKFLKEFKAQLFQNHSQIGGSASLRCSVPGYHPEGEPVADVCRSCYDRVNERADRMEAAMRIEVADATKIIYDAVWADTTDPTRTYQNAALAFLAELHRRAGIAAVPSTQNRAHSHGN